MIQNNDTDDITGVLDFDRDKNEEDQTKIDFENSISVSKSFGHRFKPNFSVRFRFGFIQFSYNFL